jgi:hypothetical protein
LTIPTDDDLHGWQLLDFTSDQLQAPLGTVIAFVTHPPQEEQLASSANQLLLPAHAVDPHSDRLPQWLGRTQRVKSGDGKQAGISLRVASRL